MIINTNLNSFRKEEYADTLTKEQRAEARKAMARQLGELLERSPRENLYWTESKTDLMDLVHEVFIIEHPVSGNGHPYNFKTMARLACAVLHVPEPANFYSIVYNARKRKGIKQKSFFSRYCWLLYCKKVKNPLYGMVMRVKN